MTEPTVTPASAPDSDVRAPGHPVGFTDAIRFTWNGYTRWNGRATRAEYWWWYLAAAVAGNVSAVPLQIGLGVASATGSDQLTGLLMALAILQIAVAGVLLLPTLSVEVRRLHDTGRSAAWAVVGILLPLVLVPAAVASMMLLLTGVATTNDNVASSGLLLLLVTIAAGSAYAVYVIVLLILPSTQTPTRWDSGYRPARVAPAPTPAAETAAAPTTSVPAPAAETPVDPQADPTRDEPPGT